MKFELEIKSLDESIELAKKVSTNLQKGDILCLKGDLGAGKTFFAKHIIQSILGSDIQVTSPTFQLVQTYEHIHHYDLYRLKIPEEVYEIGIDDSLDGSKIVIIEWPEIIGYILPKEVIEIEILIEDNLRKYIIDDHIGKLKW